MIEEINNKGPINYENWIDLGKIIIPCLKGRPIVPKWSDPSFKITKEHWRDRHKHCEIALRLDNVIDFDIDNEYAKRFIKNMLNLVMQYQADQQILVVIIGGRANYLQ